MAAELIMPKQGLTMDEGTLVRWLVAEGDVVAQGQAVAEIETDKVTLDLEAPAAGRMGRLEVEEGQRVPVTTRLALIYGPDETPASRERGVRVTPLARRVAEAEGVDVNALAQGGASVGRITVADVRAAAAPGDARAARVFSSPRARRRAQELGIVWQTLSGSGPRGRVIEEDVLAAAAQRGTAPEPAYAEPQVADHLGVTWEVPNAVQRVAAERMAASFGSAPHFYLTTEVLAGTLLALLERLRPSVERRHGARLTLTDLLIRIVATSLAEHARANAYWENGRVGLCMSINIGIAVATDRGLLVPVLHDLAEKRLGEIAAERSRLVDRARTGRLTAEDLAGGTFTLSNLGMYRVDAFAAILNPPQSAILAVGRVAPRPAVVAGQLAVAPTALFTLSSDHRVLDGAVAAAFLGRVAELVEEPDELLV